MLRDHNRFVGFKQVSPEKKVPIDPRTGRAADVSDSRTWGTFDQTQAWADRAGGHVGVIPLHDFLVIDFDDVVEDGFVHPWVEGWIEEIGADTELSVSGTGIHITIPVDDALRALLPRKRKVEHANLPIGKVELILGHNGVALGCLILPATKPVAVQQAATARLVEQLLALSKQPGGTGKRSRRKRSAPERSAARLEKTGEVRFDENLFAAARARGDGCERAYMTALFIKAHDPDKRGFLFYEDIFDAMTAELARMGRNHPEKAAKRLLKQAVEHELVEVAAYGSSGRKVVRHKSPEKMARVLGTELGRTALIPLDKCLAASPRRQAYLGIMRRRDGTKDRPRPTSRATRREMTGACAATQRKAERESGARVEQNYVLGTRPDRPWKRLADGRPVHQLPVSTTVRPQPDRKRLDERMVQRDDRRVYSYPGSGPSVLEPRSGYRYVGVSALESGVRINLWARV